MGKAYTAKGGASNTEVTITIPAPSAECTNALESVEFAFDVAPSSAVEMTIESPSGTVINRRWITTAGPGPISFSGSGLEGAQGQEIVVRLPAATGSIGILNATLRNH